MRVGWFWGATSSVGDFLTFVALLGLYPELLLTGGRRHWVRCSALVLCRLIRSCSGFMVRAVALVRLFGIIVRGAVVGAVLVGAFTRREEDVPV